MCERATAATAKSTGSGARGVRIRDDEHEGDSVRLPDESVPRHHECDAPYDADPDEQEKVLRGCEIKGERDADDCWYPDQVGDEPLPHVLVPSDEEGNRHQ